MNRLNRKKCPNIKRPIGVIFVFLLLLVFASPERVEGWNCDQNTDLWPQFEADRYTHQWIVKKAIQYLRSKNALPEVPLEEYEPHISYGTFFADYPYPTLKLDADRMLDFLRAIRTSPWNVIEPIDEIAVTGITHYYRNGGVRLSDTNSVLISGHINPVFNGGVTAGRQAQTLYDLAKEFWPRGPAIRDINSLPIIRSGILVNLSIGPAMPFGRYNFGPYVIGAHPFAYDVCCLNNQIDLTSANNRIIGLSLGSPTSCTGSETLAYQWPIFVQRFSTGGPVESEVSALIYLGWAIHMIEDLAMPGHSRNRTGSAHAKYERQANDNVNSGIFDRDYPVPIDPFSSNPRYRRSEWPLTPNMFSSAWGLTEASGASHSIVGTVANIAIRLQASDIDNRLTQREILFDTTIKAVAGCIYHFFTTIAEYDPEPHLPTLILRDRLRRDSIALPYQPHLPIQ